MVRTVLVVMAALLAAGGVQAQARYMCRGADGSATFSDRPCATGQVHFGGMAQQAPTVTRPVSIGEAPEHLRYMSPRCASLHDAMRTASSRGLTGDTQRTMRRDYQRECSENEREAQQEMSRLQRENRQQQATARQAERVEQDRAKVREQQCGESKRILVTKKARTDLTEGEKAELRRFEENYLARCTGNT